MDQKPGMAVVFDGERRVVVDAVQQPGRGAEHEEVERGRGANDGSAPRPRRRGAHSSIDPGEVLLRHQFAVLIGEGELHLRRRRADRCFPPSRTARATRLSTVIMSPATIGSPTIDCGLAGHRPCGSAAGGTSALGEPSGSRWSVGTKVEACIRITYGNSAGPRRRGSPTALAASSSKWIGSVASVAWANWAMSRDRDGEIEARELSLGPLSGLFGDASPTQMPMVLAMMLRWMSDVPAPITPRRDSRKCRCRSCSIV